MRRAEPSLRDKTTVPKVSEYVDCLEKGSVPVSYASFGPLEAPVWHAEGVEVHKIVFPDRGLIFGRPRAAPLGA